MNSGRDNILAQIATPHLASLARAVGAGWVHGDSPPSALSPFAGNAASALSEWLKSVEHDGFNATQVDRLLRAVIGSRDRDHTMVPDLVVSGPDVPGIPTADTHAVVQTLFQEAESEVVLAGYAFHDGTTLFERLYEQKRANPHLRLLFHVDVPRRYGDSTAADMIVTNYAKDFRQKHWPWSSTPEVFFDPRALDEDRQARASLHAKVVVVDRRKLFLTSANFTEAAQQRNIEFGLLCAAPHLAEQVCSYFEGLRHAGKLRRLPIPDVRIAD